jgi:hypothetical protein
VQHSSCPLTLVERGELRALLEDLKNSAPIRWYKLIVSGTQIKLDICASSTEEENSIHIFMEHHKLHALSTLDPVKRVNRLLF